MSRMNVNPTRMELTKLKKQLSTTSRGHKLLKDKQDEMIRQYMELIKKNRLMREEIEHDLKSIVHTFQNARLKMSYEGVMEALMVPTKKIALSVLEKTVMNVKVPLINYQDEGTIDLTYGFAFTPSELDKSVIDLSTIIPKLIELAQTEKTCESLATEIEKTRRRVNAIEFVMIPNLQETIHFITMKLEDNERSNTIRLMKSKEIILAKNANQ